MKRIKFYEMKSQLCEAYIFEFYTWVKLRKRPEVSSEPPLPYIYDYSMTFPNLGSIQLPVF